MAVVSLPVGAVFTRRAWIPPSKNQVNRSGWTGARTVLRLPGAGLWRGSFAVKQMSRERETWPWKAFLAVLEGEANTFLMPFEDCAQTSAANPTVYSGATQGGTTVTLAGMPPSALYLNGGRALSFTDPSGKRQLVLLANDLVADSAGRGVATFRGALREAPTVGATVEARRPVCEMALTSGDVGWDKDQGVYSVAFDAEEAF
jgi:hypothetical protein